MKINFQNAAHESRFYELLTRMGNTDVYHLSIAYLFALNSDCYNHIDRLYNFKEHCINHDGLDDGWQTGGSIRLTRLAYNLWNGWATNGDVIKDNTGQEIPLNSVQYTPYNLFDCEYAPYFVEAIKLRYSIYFS